MSDRPKWKKKKKWNARQTVAYGTLIKIIIKENVEINK